MLAVENGYHDGIDLFVSEREVCEVRSIMKMTENLAA